MQNDFITGTLALKNAPAGEDGEEVVDIINGLIEQHQFDATVYSFDWHPEEHCSFASNVGKYKDNITEDSPCSADIATVLSTVIFNFKKAQEQVLWPDHCTQGSEGAQLHENLKVRLVDKFLGKVNNRNVILTSRLVLLVSILSFKQFFASRGGKLPENIDNTNKDIALKWLKRK